MKKILITLESICSLGLLGIYTILLMLQNTISYEEVSAFEKTPKSTLFVIMEHNHILGYLSVIFGVLLAIATIIKLLHLRKQEI
jgi:hypothetical protein